LRFETPLEEIDVAYATSTIIRAVRGTAIPKMSQEISADELLAVLNRSKSIRVRAGTGEHRFIGIWFVLVKDRILARSWSVKPGGWYCTFLSQPRGAIQVGKVEIPVRAVPIKHKGMRDAADRAYLEKYSTGWEVKYARDLVGEKSRAATIELVPVFQSSTRR
jgi:hypothetical protein